jgi:hypothetical protein
MFGKKKTTKKLKGDAAHQLRTDLLTGPAAQVAPEGVDTSAVWLAAVETVKPEATITYMSLSDGTTTVIYSSGAGLEGLRDVDAVATASTEFVDVTSQTMDMLDKNNDLTLPERGMVRMYARQGDDTYSAESLEDIVAAGGHPLTPQYKKALSVMKQVQLAESR